MAQLGCGETHRPHCPRSRPASLVSSDPPGLWPGQCLVNTNNSSCLQAPGRPDFLWHIKSLDRETPRNTVSVASSQVMLTIPGSALPALGSSPSRWQLQIVHLLHCVWIFTSWSLKRPLQVQALLKNGVSSYKLLATDHQGTTLFQYRDLSLLDTMRY